MKNNKPQTVDDILATEIVGVDDKGHHYPIPDAKQALQELILSWLPENLYRDVGREDLWESNREAGFREAIQEMKQRIIEGFKS